MDEMELEGRTFVSARKASEITGYEQDYIGQLARMGRVVARQIGRAWFIDHESLLSHKAAGRKSYRKKNTISKAPETSVLEVRVDPTPEVSIVETPVIEKPVAEVKEESLVGTPIPIHTPHITEEDTPIETSTPTPPQNPEPRSPAPFIKPKEYIASSSINDHGLLTYIVDESSEELKQSEIVPLEVKDVRLKPSQPQASYAPARERSEQPSRALPIFAGVVGFLLLTATSFISSSITDDRIFHRSGQEFSSSRSWGLELSSLQEFADSIGLASVLSFLE